MPNVECIPSRDAVDCWWETHTRPSGVIGPQGFGDTVCRGLPDPEAIELTVSDLPKARAALGLFGRDDEYLIGTSIRMDEGPCLYNDATLFAPSLQGNGHGTRVTANLIACADALDMPELQLVACMGGPYAWVAMGFVPLEKDWDDVRERIRWFMELMDGELEDAEVSLLADVAGNNDPRAIRLLSLLDRELEDPPIRDFAGHTVGRALLAHTGMRFEAVLDLSNDDDRDYFLEYSWRYGFA